MTKLTRLTGKVFGETATATGDDPEIGQFGSALAGTYVGTTDVAAIQNLPAWSNGFIDSVTPSTQFPPLPEMTGFGKVLSYQTAYTLQQGIPEWDSATTYYEDSFCSYQGIIYKSLTDENLNNNPSSDTVNWTVYQYGDFANKDLSNLTTAGKDKVVALAHELDYANVISVTTTSSNSVRTYTCPSDGILSVCTVVGTGTTKSVQAIIYDTNDNMMFENSINQATSTASIGTSVYWTYLKGETAHYKAYVSGGTTTVIVTFIPFKKS